MRRLACCFAMLLSTALLGSGCKSEDPKPKLVPTGVALFLNGTYVDYSSIAPLSWHEARNVEAHLVATGLPLTTFTGITSTDIDAAVAGKATLAIPEQEVSSLNAALDAAARTSIEAFVAGGGTLIVFDADYNSTTLLNGVFGFAMSSAYTTASSTLNATAAAGTPFAAGPSSIPGNDATYGITSATVPSGGLKIYTNALGYSTVTLIPHGAGSIVVLGWDWYDALPLGTLDGGWIDVLDRALAL